MKLIHCADLHLDSPMESNLPPEKARERKNEILSTFAKLVRVAEDGGVGGILIAGDLFDRDHVTKKTSGYVLDLIRSHPSLRFFYLAGNHDSSNFLREAEDLPENLYTFDNAWRSYAFGDVVITGSEHPDADSLRLKEGDLNILLLHGQEGSPGDRKENRIPFAKLKNKHIDYIALGHLHDYRTAQIDSRCTACYSGCLEGRGFDECGEKGYVLLEIANGKLTHRFVPLARRRLHAIPCDVTDFSSQLDLEERVLRSVEGIPSADLVKVILRGQCPAESQKDLPHLQQVLAERFYFAKLTDETRLLIRPEDYRNDISLKGEFVRRVLASNLNETEKERIIACGFRALSGEEIGI